jgi:ankyrin repeat protein
MRNIEELFKDISSVPDYAGIEVVDANTLGNFNSYPLHVVSVWGDCEGIELLCNAGAEINQIGEYGYTALAYAAEHGHYEAVKLLIKLGAKPIPISIGSMPSELVSSSSHGELYAYLKQNGF